MILLQKPGDFIKKIIFWGFDDLKLKKLEIWGFRYPPHTPSNSFGLFFLEKTHPPNIIPIDKHSNLFWRDLNMSSNLPKLIDSATSALVINLDVSDMNLDMSDWISKKSCSHQGGKKILFFQSALGRGNFWNFLIWEEVFQSLSWYIWRSKMCGRDFSYWHL